MFAHTCRFAALTAAAWLVLPFGTVAAQEAEAAPPTEQPCGGFAGLACPEGYSCVDDPRDDCNQRAGDADCSGICSAAGGGDDSRLEGSSGKAHCNYGDQDLQYVAKDPDQCAAVTFICEDGYEGFFNDCGCGCQPIQ